MTLSLTHTFVSAIPDGADATVVRPSNWNDTHTVAGTLPIANGGTNTASVPANGQLLIGNGTDYTVANLTAGTGVTITNTAGGISIAAPDNGTVTAVTASSPIASSGGTAPNISLTGTVAIANGGTNTTATPTAGAIVYGTGIAQEYTAAGTTGQVLTSATAGTPTWSTPTTGTVTSVAQSFTGGIISVSGSPITSSGTLALTVAGTSGGVPYFSSASTWATSAALAASALVIGGGAGAAPATTATGTGVVAALGVNTGSAGAIVLFNGALGTPTSGTVTNLTGTASININGTVGATTASTGAFTTLSTSGLLTAAAGVSSTLTTDATSATTGSIITAGGISTQKALWVGTTSRLVGAVTMNAALTYGGVTLSNAVTGTGNMVLSASPTLTGTLTAATASLSGLSVTGALASFLGPSSGTGYSAQFYNNAVSGSVDIYIEQSNGTSSGTQGTMRVSKAAANNRSINATGTINASGADYAEYMVKAKSCGVIAKGDIAGVDVDGNLTDKYANAHSFVVKSTNPSYVGGDSWSDGNPAVGPRPEPTSTKDEADLVKWKERHETARATVDRIAFSGQVPVNVTGATVGDYIVPLAGPDGGITGQAVTNPTFDQYRAAVGRVWKILEDGRAFVSVKVS